MPTVRPHQTQCAGRETTRAIRAVQILAGDKDRTSFHRVGGSLSQARSRDSTEGHEHCAANMLVQSSMIKCLKPILPVRGRAGIAALGLAMI